MDALPDELLHGEDVAQRPGRIRPTVGDEVRPLPVRFGLLEGLSQGVLPVRTFARPDEARPEQLIQQKIGGCLPWPIAGQDQAAFKAEAGGRGGGLPAVVGLDRTGGDEHVRALSLRLGDEKLQFTGLVPAEGQAGLVVALDQQVRAAEGRGQARQ